jgi:serine protease AprX
MIFSKRFIVVSAFFVCVVLAGLKFGMVSSADLASADDKAASPPFVYAVDPAAKIARQVLTDTEGGERASVVVFLTDQANVDAAYEMKDQDARGWFVYNTLTSHAERTQAPIKAMLDAENIPYQSFWVANMLVIEADRSLVERLAERDDVALLDPNRPAYWIEPPDIADRREADLNDVPFTAEWGVNNVNAPAVWAMGFTGQGIVIGNQDTGIRWTHNAIKPKYRGWNGAAADHNYNWHDAIHSGGGSCGPNTQAPCDDNGHGTHTTGTTTGDDGFGNQVGVAPGAKWIGCRNMNQGIGTPATYSECFQFFIAPTNLAGGNPNPALRPHVMNNSWGCPASEGCVTRAELETIVNNTQASGIFVEVSAGNAGPGCNSVVDAPAIYSSSFSTGSITSSNTISSFSSRGPSNFYNPSILKPNVSAPGSNVRSSTSGSDTSYGNSSGTSMAGPHVVGVVALLWSARPQLARDIAATKDILQNTANPNVIVSPVQTCGGTSSTQIPNNTFGYGRVDALAAVNSVPGCQPGPDYVATSSTGAAVVPGTSQVPGSVCNNCTVSIPLPFSYEFYGTPYSQVVAGNDGTLQFTGNSTNNANTCLPAAGMTNTIFAYWDDLNTNVSDQMGIFTSVSGTAPNRIFNIEWRAGYVASDAAANFEVRLYEGQPKFEIVYGNVTRRGFSATIGVQQDGGSQHMTQYACNTINTIQNGQKVTFDQRACRSFSLAD